MPTWLKPAGIIFPLLVLLVGCTSAPAGTLPATPPPAVALTNTLAATPTRLPSPTATPPQPPTPPPTPTPDPPAVCSPLEGYALSDLAGMIVNPYAPPPVGSDQPHQGIDLAQLDPATRIALPGLPVRALLAGEVVMVTNNRFPYGNAVLVKVPFDAVTATGLNPTALPTPMPTLAANPALTCPQPENIPAWDPNHRALFVLYAHLQNTPMVQPGEQIRCGQELGTIGDSGNALNPHLHLEVRVGPADAALSGMAHYDNSATPMEMAAYCLWRVSGWFQPVNPEIFFAETK
ncbi:MAG TPA: M23 family metallopeptidase [Anaerolineaceae bacterium]|nr:M23 family metallopeptidase [Anaerolineaceae bacterium]